MFIKSRPNGFENYIRGFDFTETYLLGSCYPQGKEGYNDNDHDQDRLDYFKSHMFPMIFHLSNHTCFHDFTWSSQIITMAFAFWMHFELFKRMFHEFTVKMCALYTDTHLALPRLGCHMNAPYQNMSSNPRHLSLISQRTSSFHQTYIIRKQCT